MTIIRAIVAGERDPNVLASHRERGCHASVETICQALVGNYREEHVFALSQAIELYDVYQTKVAACDKQIEAILKRLKKSATPPASKLLPPRHRSCQPNAPSFDARAALHAILGVDLTQIHGLGPYLALKLVGECGTNLTAWPTAKHFTSWLGLAPHNKISGGKVLSSKTRRTSNRAASCYGLPPCRLGEPIPRWVPSIAACRPARERRRRSPPPPAKSPSSALIASKGAVECLDPGCDFRHRPGRDLNRRRARASRRVIQAQDVPRQSSAPGTSLSRSRRTASERDRRRRAEAAS